ncbi:armadillo/beta-catenin-like repeat-containing protein [Moesziomyces antarcticus T-34]|uniref:Armadillo/beta-catenin-like repeat-containing protein n=1 Tax=Pseudozyma antarctica (strain T-34) TaxID=1151754 RepID=M9MG44_PSEA3|nr:armadillo/beta-catenin-like repeat-containing protein [Moesziomyces antarcticus T-34]
MSNEKNAQELLKWGLANSTTAAGPSVEQISADIESGRRPDLADPHLYEAIMGKSEAQMMAEQLSVAVDESRSVEDRCTALDNLEMLIETIDNANNMTSMNMWPSIIGLMASSEPEVQTAAAWILGTAVQNNDKAQVAVLPHEAVRAVVDLFQSAHDKVRAKAMYALSGLIKHNPAAMDQFDKLDGWKVLRSALVDPTIGIRRKAAFLLNTLLLQDPNSLTTPVPSAAPSTATAVAPAASVGTVPLELGPETMRTSVPHPNVARALVESGILTTLLSSLLPPGTHGIDDADLPPPSGPDGDQDPRSDLDFAEKAAAATLAFAAKLPNIPSKAHLDQKTKSLFKALLNELHGPPFDTSTAAKSRADELALDSQQLHTLTATINAL